MNARHFLAFLWLRWRMRVNQLKRFGTVNLVITMMFVAAAIPGAVMLFIGAFIAGAFGLPALADARPGDFPTILLLIWDGVALLFLFAWSIGLLAELQRSEALSIDKFLHLPVSLSGVFVINYLSSLASLNLVLFVPIMVGLILGMAVGLGPAMLLLLPLLAAFLLAVTGPTYQFQGWLATLMANPRRRRTIIVVVTMVFILISQLPQLVHVFQPQIRNRENELMQAQNAEMAQLDIAKATRKITPEQYNARSAELAQKYQQKRDEFDHRVWREVLEWAVVANMALPPGWFALGAWGLQQGNVWPALAGTLGLALLGTASLWRAYRTTLAFYTGRFSAGARKPAVVAAPGARARQTAGIDVSRTPSAGRVRARRGDRAGQLPGTHARSRSQDDLGRARHHARRFRRHARPDGRSAGDGAAAAAVRRDGGDAAQHDAAHRQPIRLRPQRLSRVRALPGAAPRDHHR